MRLLIAALALGVSSPVCLAEDCRSIPPGPDKRACVMRNNPNFETKFDRCNQRVDGLGFVVGQPGIQGRKGLMQACMQGRPN